MSLLYTFLAADKGLTGGSAYVYWAPARNGHLAVEYVDNVTSDAVFAAILPRLYAGGTITVRAFWMAETATSGNVVWQTQIERCTEGGQDLDSDGYGTAVSVTTAAPGTLGALAVSSMDLDTSGKLDSVAAGDYFRLLVSRLGNSGSDTMSGYAQLVRVELVE